MVRAMYDWCVDNQLTPFIVVAVDASVRVPTEFVRDGEIVLNISMGATSSLTLSNDYIDFKARFGGVAREISVPMGRVSAIYARENGQGMAFPVSDDEAAPAVLTAVDVPTPLSDQGDEPQPPSPPAGRPALKRVK
jgi:stringent starvation protein B